VKAIVETGVYGRKVVVCGAPNCRPGMFAAYVPIGKKAIGGVESDGMLASGAELGVNRDDAGILELAGPVGAPLANCTPTASSRSTTSPSPTAPTYGVTTAWRAKWPPFCASPSAIRCSRRSSLPEPASIPSPINVDIQDLDLCPRYSALVFDNVTVQPSPLWLQYRLTAIGLNPINNIVDMTNFIMSELSQPMHAFDRDLLRAIPSSFARAHEGEILPGPE